VNIAFVVNTFPQFSETFILSQIVGLLRRGHQVVIYAEQPDGDLAAVHPEVDQYRLLERTQYRTGCPAGRWDRTRGAAALLCRWGWRIPRRTLESLNVFRHGRRALNLNMLYDSLPREQIGACHDVVHCHFGPNGQRAVAARRAGAFRAPIITTFHGFDANVLPRSFGPGYYRYLFRHGDLFTVGSEFMRRRILGCGAPADRIVHLPMGVDTERFAFSNRSIPPDGRIAVLTVARLAEVKGIEYVLHAIALIKSQYPKLQYVVAGDGPLRDSLSALTVKLGITDQVRFLGAVSRDRIPGLHRAAHIFVLASVVTASGEEENQPVSVAEAQASGLPVIATSIGGIPESLRDGASGFLVPPRDPHAIAAALTWLIENQDAWSRMGRAGRRHVEQHFDGEKLNDRLIDIYRTALAGSTARETCGVSR